MKTDSFAYRLHQLMINKGVNQSDVAAALFGRVRDKRGYLVAAKRDRLCVWLKGTAVPDAVNLKKLADYFKTSASDLMPTPPDDRYSDVSLTTAGDGKVWLRVERKMSMARATKILTIMDEGHHAAAS